MQNVRGANSDTGCGGERGTATWDGGVQSVQIEDEARTPALPRACLQCMCITALFAVAGLVLIRWYQKIGQIYTNYIYTRK